MIISIHQNNLLNPSDIYESYNTVIADEFNFPYFFATNITRKLKIVIWRKLNCACHVVFSLSISFSAEWPRGVEQIGYARCFVTFL